MQRANTAPTVAPAVIGEVAPPANSIEFEEEGPLTQQRNVAPVARIMKRAKPSGTTTPLSTTPNTPVAPAAVVSSSHSSPTSPVVAKGDESAAEEYERIRNRIFAAKEAEAKEAEEGGNGGGDKEERNTLEVIDCGPNACSSSSGVSGGPDKKWKSNTADMSDYVRGRRAPQQQVCYRPDGSSYMPQGTIPQHSHQHSYHRLPMNNSGSPHSSISHQHHDSSYHRGPPPPSQNYQPAPVHSGHHHHYGHHHHSQHHQVYNSVSGAIQSGGPHGKPNQQQQQQPPQQPFQQAWGGGKQMSVVVGYKNAPSPPVSSVAPPRHQLSADAPVWQPPSAPQQQPPQQPRQHNPYQQQPQQLKHSWGN